MNARPELTRGILGFERVEALEVRNGLANVLRALIILVVKVIACVGVDVMETINQRKCDKQNKNMDEKTSTIGHQASH